MTGGASYTVSLPKDWVKEQGLKVGDVVAVMPRSDSSLTLIPHEKMPTGKNRGAEVTISPPKEQDKEQILRTILAQYLAGYDIIRVRFPATARPDLRTYLREAARKMFVGSEIIEESKDELIMQCLSSYGDLPAPKVISRMSLIAKLMLRDAVDSLKGRDPALAEEIIHRDEEVDRFYLFIIRQLTMAVLNRSLILEIGLADPRDCLVYRVVSKSLERIADHATTIAKMFASIESPLPPRLIDEISKASNITINVLEDALKALAKSDGTLANNSIVSAEGVERGRECDGQAFHLQAQPKVHRRGPSCPRESQMNIGVFRGCRGNGHKSDGPKTGTLLTISGICVLKVVSPFFRRPFGT